ncbi:6-cysteine protein [Plasmodium gonderi]|uniref:6-cysteine protein n=1 Tax=Plasmodium gonderi TaxID=77519 RepID=A0A1Y1JKD4_PLAGO|nr:6-cysteine protein [Plasmodium gonderi]GAW81895.1 6-cysteine protein [Plasmodium gonderi]
MRVVAQLSFLQIVLFQILLIPRYPVQKEAQFFLPVKENQEPGSFNMTNEKSKVCDFSSGSLSVFGRDNPVSSREDKFGTKLDVDKKEEPTGSWISNNDSNDNEVKHCVHFTKGLEVLTFICPKRNGNNYKGIEVRPFNCFEEVRVQHVNIKRFSNILKGVYYESKETDILTIRKVFIPPTIYEDTIFECTCDNSLTFQNGMMGSSGGNPTREEAGPTSGAIGSRGIMRVHLKKNFIFGCDFDHTGSSDGGHSIIDNRRKEGESIGEDEFSQEKKSAFSKFYTPSEINNLKEKGIIHNVKITKREVYLGLICPPGYYIYPSNCFENVLYENNIVKLKELVSHDIKFHIDNKRRMSFATFTLKKNENPRGFTCLCVSMNTTLHNQQQPLQVNFEYNNYESFAFSVHMGYLLIVLLFMILCF